MKRIFSLLLVLSILSALLIPVSAADGLEELTVTSFPMPQAGKTPVRTVTLSTGTLKQFDWFAVTDGKSSPMGEGDTFAAGGRYAADLYVDPPTGFEWQQLEVGGMVLTDMPDVRVKILNDDGKEIEYAGCYLEHGTLLISVVLDCPGTPDPQPQPQPEPVVAGDPKIRPDFKDVAPSDWFYDWVYNAVDLGLVNGKGKDTDGRDYFAPAGNITFAETAKLAACIHQLYTTGTVTLQNGSPWYKSYVDYCGENGILMPDAEHGGIAVGDVMTRANEAVTRAEFAWIFSRALPDAGLPVKNTIPDSSIPDVKDASSEWYAPIYKLYRAGIVNGKDDAGSFLPGDKIQRSEVAAISVRMIDADKRAPAPKGIGG